MTRSLACAVVLLLCACAAPSGPSGSAAPLTSAMPTEGDPAVVAVLGAPLGCTGTLVGERAVLTAAHCRVQDDPRAVDVFFGSEIGGEGTSVPVLHAVAHPEADDTADHDLALLLLAEEPPAEPVQLATEPTVAQSPPVAVRLVGFGVTAADAGDDDRKREGASVTTEVTPWHVVLGADPSLPCLGDSGGPALVSTGPGERLAGVVSRGDAACTSQGKATRVDTHLEGFIRPQLDAWAAGDVPGELGDECASDDDCLSDDCLEAQAMCSMRCVSGRGDCPGGFVCEHLGGIDFYCLPDPGDDSGCRVTGSHPAGVLSPMLLALLLLWRRRR